MAEKNITDLTTASMGSYSPTANTNIFTKSGSSITWANITDILKYYFNKSGNDIVLNNATNLKLSNGKSIQDNANNIDMLMTYITNNGNDNAGFANSVFRGKNLGTSFTDAQSKDITSGTFQLVRLGDYWNIGGITWRVADCDYFIHCGDNIDLGHHVVIVPDQNLKNGDGETTVCAMNDTNTTDGGYVNSKMKKTIIPSDEVTGKITSAFGSHVVQYRSLLCNAVANGVASGWEWCDTKVDLMNEYMVYGSSVTGNGVYNAGIRKTQLSLFRVARRFINTRQPYWLSDCVSPSVFAIVALSGDAYWDGAGNPWLGCRPFILLR